MEVSKTIEGEWKAQGAPRSEVEKTAAKIKCDHGDVKSDWSFCNDKFTMNVKGNPLDSKDYPSSAELKTECKPAKKEYKLKLLFDISTPDFSGVQFYENVSLHSTTQSKKIQL